MCVKREQFVLETNATTTTYIITYLPENATVARFGHVGENRVLLNRFHSDGISFVISSCVL